MSYAGAAANVVGGELQGWASVLDKWAMQKAFSDEMARQAAYQRQGTGAFTQGLMGATPGVVQQQLGQGAQNREQQYARINQAPLGFGMQTTPRDQANAALLGQGRAQQGAYSDMGLQQMINQLNTQRQLNQISNFAKGTAGVFPYRMYEAQHSMDDLAMIGAAISSIGGGAANYAQFAQAPQAQQASVAYPGQQQQIQMMNDYYGTPNSPANLQYQQGDPNAGFYTGWTPG